MLPAAIALTASLFARIAQSPEAPFSHPNYIGIQAQVVFEHHAHTINEVVRQFASRNVRARLRITSTKEGSATTFAHDGPLIAVPAHIFLVPHGSELGHASLQHEFAHVQYEQLPRAERDKFEELYHETMQQCITEVFAERHYLPRPQMGNPQQNPGELYASGYNAEKHSQQVFRLLKPEHHELAEKVFRFVRETSVPK